MSSSSQRVASAHPNRAVSLSRSLRRVWRAGLKDVAFYISAGALTLFFAFPYLWQILTALKLPDQLYAMPPTWWPSDLYLESFKNVFTGRPFLIYIRNSAIVATSTMLFCLVLGSFAAYALARLQLKGKMFILAIILSVSMFPSLTVVGPLFIVMRGLGWLNTFQGLVLPYTSFAMPFTLWVLTNFFKQIPGELEEAAEVDGCTPVQALFKIILPLAAPGLATTGILVFILAWNEFLFAYTFTRSELTRTIPVAIVMFRGIYDQVPWGEMAAASVIVTLPLIVLVILFQRRIVEGLSAGAVKG